MNTTMTPEQLEAKAVSYRQEAADSFDRCDTDGYLSQWALGICAQRDELKAMLLRNGNVYDFPALFDLQGNRVKAKIVMVSNRYRYGIKEAKWLVLDSADNAVLWLAPLAFDYGPEEALPNKRSANRLRKAGFVEGTETAPAKVVISGSAAHIVRADEGYPEGSVVKA